MPVAILEYACPSCGEVVLFLREPNFAGPEPFRKYFAAKGISSEITECPRCGVRLDPEDALQAADSDSDQGER